MDQESKIIVRSRPKPYPLTQHQLEFREVLETCGIVKGMSRADLIEKMKTCVPEEWKKKKEAVEQPPSSSGPLS